MAREEVWLNERGRGEGERRERKGRERENEEEKKKAGREKRWKKGERQGGRKIAMGKQHLR